MVVITDPAAESFPAPEGRPRIREGTAGAVVAEHLARNLTLLIELEGPVRADEPDAVHQMRVATRRLRSAMATFRPVLARPVTEPFRDELRWLGTALGTARDAEVQRDRLVAAARALPSDLVLGPVVDRIDTELRRRHGEATDGLLVTLDDDRTRALLGLAAELIRTPPLDGAAAEGAGSLAKLVERSCRRVDRAAVRADPATTDPAGLLRLHELRKAAKRARYAAEAVTGVFGRRAARLAARMEDLQDVLGEHQDSVDARVTLRSLGVIAHLSGENGFTFGLLHGLESRASRDALDQVDHLVRRATHRPAKASLR